jgi:two-component system sensor histidine kinase MprB
MSLRARMGLAAGVAVALAVVAVAVSSYAGTRSELRGQIDNSLRNIASQALNPQGGPGGHGTPGSLGGGGPPGAAGSGLGFAASQTPGEPPGVGDEGLGIDRRPGPQFGGATGAVTLVYRNGGTDVIRGYKIPPDARLKELAASGRGRYFTDMQVRGTHIRVYATGIGVDGALAVALPLTDVDRTLSHELLLILLIAAGGIALAALLGILVARTALAPIARFTKQTELIALHPDRLEHERLQVSGNDELARLGRTFNTTLDALERSIESQRNLVADASHELRTPIANIRVAMEVASAHPDRANWIDVAGDVLEQGARMERMTDDLLLLGRTGETSVPLRLGPVDLGDLVAAELSRAVPADRRLVASEVAAVTITGDREQLARMLSNLVDNALRHARRQVTVAVTVGSSSVEIKVADDGPGIDRADREVVFNPFVRLDGHRDRHQGGAGLGLAIVRQVVLAHHGTIGLRDNSPGALFVVRLPLSGSSQELIPTVQA